MADVEVEPETVAQHGANFANVVGGVLEQCQDAAAQTEGAGLNESYGLLISPLAWPVMSVVTANAKDSLAAAKAFNDALKTALEGVSACYAGVDQAAADDFDKLAEELG
ncbi:hypothetical protein LO763_13200 [Glycomyces sp. A-F 0318]|uniref:type VII secretion target n=1 Tax=Glycomyces amatae TaxID=2881355 RepID=UPI001E3DB2E4|nr:type VII secretion target [Glycomyces amatae]MCD0444578.1 hypothetical protein [Glycomyces amatae]